MNYRGGEAGGRTDIHWTGCGEGPRSLLRGPETKTFERVTVVRVYEYMCTRRQPQVRTGVPRRTRTFHLIHLRSAVYPANRADILASIKI